MALASEQMVKSVSFEPPTSLLVYSGKMTDQLDVDGCHESGPLFECLRAGNGAVLISLGKTAVADLTKSDLCTMDPFIAKATGIELGYVAPEDQSRFFEETNPLFSVPRDREFETGPFVSH